MHQSSAKPALYRHFHRLAWLACALAFGVIVFGAFVRLSNAGLSCPDWPTCYGRAAWPTDANHVVDHAATAIRPVEVAQGLARTVASHARRFARRAGAGAGVAGGAPASRFGIAQIADRRGARSASRSRCTCAAQHVAAAVLAAIGEALLLFAALRWSNARPRARRRRSTLAVIVFQALLGMWTVTWLLKPVVVMGHLLGGLTDVRAADVDRVARDRPADPAAGRRAPAHAADRRRRVARAADRARRLDQRQLRRARLRHRFPELRRALVAAARFPRRLRAVARHRRRLRRRRARRRLAHRDPARAPDDGGGRVRLPAVAGAALVAHARHARRRRVCWARW